MASCVGTGDGATDTVKFKILQKIGAGAFGSVFMCEDNYSRKLAIKVESANNSNSCLENEYNIYAKLKKIKGIPKIFGFKRSGNKLMLSMEVLGPSLSEIIKNRKSPFSSSQVLRVAIQLMERLSCIHSRGILHRDLKPSNLVIGIDNNKDVIYMIDFGLSKVFINQNTHTQIPFQDGLRFAGTAPFASLSAHEGHEQSPKDDLESVGYVLVYLAKGSLPWYNSTTKKPANIQQALADIKEKKLSTTIEELCEGVPHPIQNLFLECGRLKYEDVPDYNNLAQLFSFDL